jgi:hypothetical protein
MGFINQLVTGGPHIVGNICKYDLNIGLKPTIHATYIGYIYNIGKLWDMELFYH